MATHKQIAANRANAKRSTGPKTLAGKLKSSRNAYRHGLSKPLQYDPVQPKKIEALMWALVGEDASDAQVDAATEVAMAQLELFRVRAVRTTLFGKIDITSGDIKDLKRLAALDRYENIAQTRRRRASAKLKQDN
jgi:hypothetical protein